MCPQANAESTSSALLARATPEMYRRNAFRVTGLATNVSNAELRAAADRRRLEDRMGIKSQASRGVLPVEPPPDADQTREAFDRLYDPLSRLVDEVFWFWFEGPDDPAQTLLNKGDRRGAAQIWVRADIKPSVEPGKPGTTSLSGGLATHNLAVLWHTEALDLEALPGPLSPEEQRLRDWYWCEALKCWKAVIDHSVFWELLGRRVSADPDPRAKAFSAEHLWKELPGALLLPNAIFAAKAIDRGDLEEVGRHNALIRSVGFDASQVDVALHQVSGIVRRRLEQFCHEADVAVENEPAAGNKLASGVIDAARRRLLGVDQLIPRGHPLGDALHDRVSECVSQCAIGFGNKTQEWSACLVDLNWAIGNARGPAIVQRTQSNMLIVRSNIGGQELEALLSKMTAAIAAVKPGDDSENSRQGVAKVRNTLIRSHLETIKNTIVPGLAKNATEAGKRSRADDVAAWLLKVSYTLNNECGDPATALEAVQLAAGLASESELKSRLAGGIKTLGLLATQRADSQVSAKGETSSGRSTRSRAGQQQAASDPVALGPGRVLGALIAVVSVIALAAVLVVRKSSVPNPQWAPASGTSIAAPAVAVSPVAVPTREPLPTPRPPVSLKNGTILKRFKAPSGRSKITVTNGNSQDAVFVVRGTNESGRDWTAFYVRGDSAYTLSGVPPGTYVLAYVLGIGWNRTARKFDTELARSRFEDDAVFQEEPEWKEERDGYVYTHKPFHRLELTLHTVSGGNARTTSARPEDVTLEEE